MPKGHVPLRWKGHDYYFHGGHFYRHRDHRYHWIKPPRGIIVPLLPLLFTTMVIAGVTYYYYDDVYYRRVPAGYVVVDAPTPVVVQPPTTGAAYNVAVTAPSLNVREGPGPNYRVMEVMPQGATLVVHATSPGWLYVQLPSGQFGWVAQIYTAPVAPTPSG